MAAFRSIRRATDAGEGDVVCKMGIAHRLDVHPDRLREGDHRVVYSFRLADDAERARVGEEQEMVDARHPRFC